MRFTIHCASSKYLSFALLLALMLSSIGFDAVAKNADEDTYWCPMRGAPCQLDDYKEAGRCDDCKMPLVTKASYLSRVKAVEENKITLGVVLYPGFELLDVFGPLEMFAYAEEIDIVMIAEKKGAVVSGQGPSANADYTLEDAPPLDLIMIPGGAGTFAELSNEKLLQWLRERSADAQITMSVCTGSAILAKAGILDGHRATSNKQFYSLATSQSEEVDWRRVGSTTVPW